MSERLITAGGGQSRAAIGPDSHLRLLRRLASLAMLVAADITAFAIAAHLFRDGRSVPALVFFPRVGSQAKPIDIFYVLAGVFVFIRYVLGDYSKRRLFWDSARSTTLTILLAAAPCVLLLMAMPGQYSSVAEIGSWGLVLFAVPMCRQAARIVLRFLGLWNVPTALLASGSRAQEVYSALNNTLSLGCEIRWLALETADGGYIPTDMQQLKQLHLRAPAEIAEKLALDGCDQAVVATDDMQSTEFADLIQRLMEAGISVSFIPSFRRLPLVGVTTSYFFGKDILLFQVRSSLQSLPSRFVKRTFDIVVSAILLTVFAPLFAAIAVAIKKSDGGPLIYAQKRTGRHGEPFKCLKFRSMAIDADERLERWRVDNPRLYEEFQKTFKLVNDPRITGPGKWLRKTSLDELPQLVNVLRGEMSLVGPRPVLERELIEYYGHAAQLYRRVRPGITGLWQIRGRSDTTYAERVVYDEWYILNWSFWYDIVILLQTFWTVLCGKGAY